MKIANLLKPSNILYFDQVESKEWLIKEMLTKIIASYGNDYFDPDLTGSFYKMVLEREATCSTGIGDAIAFPHGRITGLNRPVIALGIIPNGVEFDAIDQQPVKLVCLFLFPANRYEIGVKIQAVFARFLSQNDNLAKLLNSAERESAYQLIKSNDLAIDSPIMAQDLMRKAKIMLKEDMPLQEVTRLMNEFNTEVTPVVDDNGKLIGEIDCIHLFQMELPDYIKNLHSVPPLHDFNPFSNYFADDSEISVTRVLNPEVARVEADASMLEVIFLLAVKKHSIVHVCQDDKLIGVIDRITVLNKVFNL